MLNLLYSLIERYQHARASLQAPSAHQSCDSSITLTFLRTIRFDVFVKNKVYFEFLLELEAFQRSFQGDNSSKDPLRTIQAHLIGLDSTKNSLVFAAHQKKSSVDDEGIVKCKGRVVLS
jgi:hypothetical protein